MPQWVKRLLVRVFYGFTCTTQIVSLLATNLKWVCSCKYKSVSENVSMVYEVNVLETLLCSVLLFYQIVGSYWKSRLQTLYTDLQGIFDDVWFWKNIKIHEKFEKGPFFLVPLMCRTTTLVSKYISFVSTVFLKNVFSHLFISVTQKAMNPFFTSTLSNI